MRLSLLHEMAVTTGAIAFSPGVTTTSEDGKFKKKKKKDDDYKGDPVTGKPKKGNKEDGKILLGGETK